MIRRALTFTFLALFIGCGTNPTFNRTRIITDFKDMDERQIKLYFDECLKRGKRFIYIGGEGGSPLVDNGEIDYITRLLTDDSLPIQSVGCTGGVDSARTFNRHMIKELQKIYPQTDVEITLGKIRISTLSTIIKQTQNRLRQRRANIRENTLSEVSDYDTIKVYFDGDHVVKIDSFIDRSPIRFIPRDKFEAAKNAAKQKAAKTGFHHPIPRGMVQTEFYYDSETLIYATESEYISMSPLADVDIMRPDDGFYTEYFFIGDNIVKEYQMGAKKISDSLPISEKAIRLVSLSNTYLKMLRQ